MYIIDKEANKIVKIVQKSFKDLGFDERNNLQEWIAKEPSALGEDLLIIQKEFDGFSDTRERLDLLALDKDGNLVIIENKLDDSGRDVTWQAIKYASYCSSLSKQDVIDIYQKYLGTTKSAKESLSDFFDGKDLDDIEINAGNGQRIFFVAANFRKEVTSSVMWLMNFNLHIKCFKVTPFEYNGKYLLDIDQIIPVKDADEYIIKIASKKQDETKEGERRNERGNLRREFWEEFIEYCRNTNGIYADNSPSAENWIGKSVKGSMGLSDNVIVNSDCCRAEIYINNGSKEVNKEVFDNLLSKKSEIEDSLGWPLTWERMDDKVTCRIRIDRNLSFLKDEEREQVKQFLSESAGRLMEVFRKYAPKKK